MSREYYTEADLKKIQDEIDYRRTVVRRESLEAVKEARAQGDLSENFEYKAARADTRQNESRIQYLEKLLKNAVIISDDSAADEVGLNNRVELYFEDDDETDTYKIVTSIRGNSLKNYISVESPLGKAVLGHRVGDRVEVTVNPAVSYMVEIRAIDKSADESDDAIRQY